VISFPDSGCLDIRNVRASYSKSESGATGLDGELPSGSVIPRQNRILPFATPGRNLSFWNSVPKLTIGGTPIPFPPPSPQITPVYAFLCQSMSSYGDRSRTTRDNSSVRIRVCHESHSSYGIPPGRGTLDSPVLNARYPISAWRLKACVDGQNMLQTGADVTC
jgi:hypothetical protein